MTKIYGLFDPRLPSVVMYVGKGWEKRARSHWKRFHAKSTAVNALLRLWFEQLKSEGVEPAWRFLEENVIDWQEAERRWIAHWRMMNPALCNVANGGNEWPIKIKGLGAHVVNKLYPGAAAARLRSFHIDNPEVAREAGRKGGRIGGKLGGGHEAGIAALNKARTIEHQRKAGRIGGLIGGRAAHQLHPGLASRMGKRSAELHPEWGQKFGKLYGIKGMHNRWHVARGKPNSTCSLCQEAKLA